MMETEQAHMPQTLPHYAVTVKLEGSEMLLQALDDHMRTCELAKALVWERDALQSELIALRKKFENQA